MSHQPSNTDAAKPIRLALIALGGVNRWLFRPAIQQCPAVKLVAGVSPTAQSRDSFANNWPIPVYERFDQMIAREKVDAVVIGSPTHLHLDHIREAARAGLHILVTKPLCNTAAECRQAIDITRRAGVTLLVGHEFRYRPAIARMIELARQGDAGPVGDATLLMMHMGHAGGLKTDTPADSWRANPANVPGGSGNLLGIHGIDLANVLFGRPRRVIAAAHRFRAHLPFEDTTAFTIEYDNASAVLTTSYVSQPLEYAHLLGARGNLLARDGKLLLEANRQSSEVTPLSQESAVARLLEQFTAAIRDGRGPESDGASALLAAVVLDAAVTSAREGCAVSICNGQE